MSALAATALPARVEAINPLAKLAVAGVIGFGLVLSLDIVSAAVALAVELALVPWLGVPPALLLRRGAPVLVAASLTALTILLYGQPSGRTHAQFLLVHVTDGSIELALATALRVLAIALPAVLLFVTVDPTDLADALGQILRLPAAFVLGALGALRLVRLLLDDWHALGQARRARGIADRGRIRGFGGQSFGLLALAIRRGTTVATAMEARGLGFPGPRSWARPSRLHARDAVFVGIGVAIVALAIASAVVTGQWTLIGTDRAG